MKILIASDHAGYHLKQKIVEYCRKLDLMITDLGTDSADMSVDYPDFADSLCRQIVGDDVIGILVCHSGIGMSMKANRFEHIRAGLCLTPEMAALTRAHNDANVLVLGSGFITDENAMKCVKLFLETAFEGGRHARRVKKLCSE